MDVEASEQLNNEPMLVIKGEPMASGGQVSIKMMPLNKIKISRNSRMSVSSEELDGLMQSIKQVGLLQPIGVIKNGTGYEVCYGNRRFMAVAKLGMSRIPVVVHDNKKAFDGDIKNLTENIQRRNLGLAEIGRYIKLLKAEGLGSAEVAVRLGVPRTYVGHCLDAFERVPKSFQKDIEVRLTPDKTGKTEPGKISIKAANAILSARKTHNLNSDDTEALFKLAKAGDGFKTEKVRDYAAAIKQGKDPLKTVKPVKILRLNLMVNEDEFDRLEAKFVTNGPFNSMTALAIAILKGEISERIKVLRA